MPVVREAGAGGRAACYGALAREILAEHRGGTVLVVAHRNTAPMMIRALGGPEGPEIPEARYTDLFVVIVSAAGEVRRVPAQ